MVEQDDEDEQDSARDGRYGKEIDRAPRMTSASQPPAGEPGSP